MKAIYIGNVRMEPRSTRETPYLFGRLQEAREFSLITGHAIYAAIPGDSAIYRVWPGGRLEQYENPKPKDPAYNPPAPERKR